jgi:hypothetical protein
MECGMNIKEILPVNAFLATMYCDQSRNFITRRIYYETGLVEAFDGKQWWTVCHLTSLQVESAKKSIAKCGLTEAEDLTLSDVYDAAILSFAWRIDDEEGMVTNWAYPAVDHPVFEKLEEELEKLEPG